ncbi:replication/maintenance protein RepL [Escherichia coli]|uniref:replication/maintenance protein RepL n=1 Tax=Escherichia coli TaxID=562 RepID=UPI003839D906
MTKTKSKYTGKETWAKLDNEGNIIEVKEVDIFERPVDGRANFMITYLSEVINLIDTLGNKKMQVVKYILKEMEKSNNILVITSRELSQKCNVSLQTVTDTLKLLEGANLIQRRVGSIMLKPRLMNNRSAKKEATMMTKYYQFDNSDEE